MEVLAKIYSDKKNSYILFIYTLLYKPLSHFETKRSLYDLRISLMFGIFLYILYSFFYLIIYLVNKEAILIITATVVWLLATIILSFKALFYRSHKIIKYTVSC